MASTSPDAYTFADSTSSKNIQPIYTSKQWAYQVDQNNNSYSSNQVIFDLSGFYNSQRFINPQEMFMVFPVCSTLSCIPTNAAAADGLGATPVQTEKIDSANQLGMRGMSNGGLVTSTYGIGYKSGNWNLIYSIQIQVDGKDVIQLTPNINYHASFVANTTWSETDIQKYGATCGFLPDVADSWKLNQLSTGVYNDGLGIVNNSICPQHLPAYPYSEDACALGGQGGTKLKFKDVMCSNDSYNSSLFQRMKWTNKYNPELHVTQTAGIVDNLETTNFKPLYRNRTMAKTNMDISLENRMVSETITPKPLAPGGVDPEIGIMGSDSTSTTAFRQLLTTCVVRFKDVCDLFSKLPLTRGLYMRVIVNMNTGYIKVGATAALTAVGATPAAITDYSLAAPKYSIVTENTFQGTCPIMLAPLEASVPQARNGGGGNNAYVAGAYPAGANLMIYPGIACDAATINRTGFYLSVSIGTYHPIHKRATPNLALDECALKQCRIYAPIIDMEPALVNQYITNFKEQAVYYKDVLQFPYPQVRGNSQQFQFQLANGIVNAKRLIIIPFYHDEAVTSATTMIPFEPLSPWSTAPSTTAPQASISNFNVLISNMNVFQRNVSYGFEEFISEIAPCNAINGSLDLGLTSGPIDMYKWSNLYRYTVVDLSRRLSGDNTPKSITVIGQNNTNYTIDYYFFLEYERHLSLDIESGHVSVSSN